MHCTASRKVEGSISNEVIEICILTQFFQQHYVPSVESVSNRN
jgi:hypothetical protein